MIRAIFFDLDGTLLSSRKTLLDSTRAALKQCRERGIRLFLATARSPRLDIMLNWSGEELSLFDGGIYCNGACLQFGQNTDYTFLAPAVVDSCLTQAARYPEVHMSLHMPDNIHAFNHFLPDTALADWGLTRGEITEIDAYCRCHTVKILMYYDSLTDASRRLPPKLYPQMQKLCADGANVYLTDQGKTIQLAAKDAGKYAAVEKIRKMLSYPADEIAVFGDDHNDMEMLSRYPHSVAMGNAPDQIKRIASCTTKTNDEDGITFALRELLSVL